MTLAVTREIINILGRQKSNDLLLIYSEFKQTMIIIIIFLLDYFRFYFIFASLCRCPDKF